MRLAQEELLVFPTSHVFDHRRGEGDVELAVVEWKGITRGLHEPQTWMSDFEIGSIFDARGRDPLGARVPLLEVVGVRGRLVRGHPDIEDRGLLGGRHRLHERSVELPAAGNIEVGDDAAPRVLAVGVVDVRTHFGSLLIGWMLKVGRCERARGRGRSGHDAGVIQRLVGSSSGEILSPRWFKFPTLLHTSSPGGESGGSGRGPNGGATEAEGRAPPPTDGLPPGGTGRSIRAGPIGAPSGRRPCAPRLISPTWTKTPADREC